MTFSGHRVFLFCVICLYVSAAQIDHLQPPSFCHTGEMICTAPCMVDIAQTVIRRIDHPSVSPRYSKFGVSLYLRIYGVRQIFPVPFFVRKIRKDHTLADVGILYPERFQTATHHPVELSLVTDQKFIYSLLYQFFNGTPKDLCIQAVTGAMPEKGTYHTSISFTIYRNYSTHF